jgi:hypothetical protein
MEIQNPPQKLFRGWKQDLADQIQGIYDQGFSTGEVAKKLDINKLRVKHYLSIMGYEFSMSEGCKRRTKSVFNDVELSKEVLEIIEGNLLGDGSLTLQKNTSKPHLVPRSAVYSHATKSLAQIEWLKKLLVDNGLPVRDYVHLKKAHQEIYKNGPNAGTIANYSDRYDFKSVSQPSIKILREKWYKPHKIVPTDLKLTPLTLLHWYLGDGTLCRNKKPVSYSVKLYTYSFTYDEVFYLKKRLLFDLDLESTVLKRHMTDGQYYIAIPSINDKNISHFFSLIGPCPPELITDYGHKWPNT